MTLHTHTFLALSEHPSENGDDNPVFPHRAAVRTECVGTFKPVSVEPGGTSSSV